MKKLLLIILFLFAAMPLMAQKYDHPIDKYIEDCMEKDMSTAGMVKCLNEAYDKYDNELNRLYKILMKELDEESAKELKSAQLEWIAFRDKEFKLIDAIYAKLEGTMYIPMRVSDRIEIVKKRVLDFEAYADLVGVNIK
ncbi:MAG: lysozyme inhibitor LprI family protein [Ignavibacteria bacterium]